MISVAQVLQNTLWRYNHYVIASKLSKGIKAFSNMGRN